MNKYLITIISIIVIIMAIVASIKIFNKPQKNINTIEIEKTSEEEIFDECTDEYEGLQIKTAKVNSEEIKTSPNCEIIIKTFFKKCGHTTEQYKQLEQELVNLTKEEIQEKYPEYKIDSFENNRIELYQEKDEQCNEHYIVKEKEGSLTIYQILEDGSQKELEVTGVTTEYLTEIDKANIKEGIRVNGKQNLNQLIEDFE